MEKRGAERERDPLGTSAHHWQQVGCQASALVPGCPASTWEPRGTLVEVRSWMVLFCFLAGRQILVESMSCLFEGVCYRGHHNIIISRGKKSLPFSLERTQVLMLGGGGKASCSHSEPSHPIPWFQVEVEVCASAGQPKHSSKRPGAKHGALGL